MLKNRPSAPAQDIEPGKLIVRFKPGVPAQDAQAAHQARGTTVLRHIRELNLDIAAVPPGTEPDAAAGYMESGLVSFAEPNVLFYPSFVPNDPFYTKKKQTQLGLQRQWGLRRINPEPAWDIVRRHAPSLKIAILDSGIDPGHPDLAAKITDPIDLSGPDPMDYTDRTGHGTFVAGIAAAATGNRRGVAGTSFNTAFIMPVKLGDRSFPLVNVLDGILYAIRNGAKVINMSLGCRFFSLSLQLAIDLAWGSNIAVVASSGDLGREQPAYPAAHNFVLGVSATDKANDQAFFANWGVGAGLAAPGDAILSTVPTYPVPSFATLTYGAAGGTSASTPFASGVAAMLFAARPGLTGQEAITAMEQAAMQPGCESGSTGPDCTEPADACSCRQCEEWSPIYGYGLLNAGRALQNPLCPDSRLGSFYGQVIDGETGLPIAGALVQARQDNKPVRQYVTKDNVPTLLPGLNTDGMFRLANLREGTYDINAIAPGKPQQNFTGAIAPGSDRYLRLVL